MARSRSTATPPTTWGTWSHSARRAVVPSDTSIRVIALEGIPEIRIGDDIGSIIGEAITRRPGAPPLAAEDVVVVTEKAVSKAEGAVVDLAGVVPGADAIEFAGRYDREPRQVQ